VDKEVT